MAQKITPKELHYIEFVNRENNFVHPTYTEDMKQYEMIRSGDLNAIEEGRKNFNPEIQGRISDDPLQNVRYLFVASAAIACRYAIAGGMPHTEAFNASDLFIRKMDHSSSIEEMKELHNEMFAYYTEGVIRSRKQSVIALPVVRCIDYIYDHLNERITVQDLALYTGLNVSYLSTLFKQETGSSVSGYIRKKKIDTACNILKYSDYSCGEVSAALAFSSQSHFIKVFRELTGYTPNDYRSRFREDNSLQKEENQR